MALTDYTYVATLGHTCAPTYQLMRAAAAMGLEPARYTGPFDWVLASVEQVIDVIGSGFRNYFAPARASVSEEPGSDYCRMVDHRGAIATHHLPRLEGQPGSNPTAWFQFGKWLGERLRSWDSHLSQRAGNVLFVRAQDALAPDSPEEIARLTRLLGTKVAGRFSVAWVCHDPPPRAPDDPRVRTFVVRRCWPPALSAAEIDWNRDYGSGVAWRGHDGDWREVWNAL